MILQTHAIKYKKLKEYDHSVPQNGTQEKERKKYWMKNVLPSFIFIYY